MLNKIGDYDEKDLDEWILRMQLLIIYGQVIDKLLQIEVCMPPPLEKGNFGSRNLPETFF